LPVEYDIIDASTKLHGGAENKAIKVNVGELSIPNVLAEDLECKVGPRIIASRNATLNKHIERKYRFLLYQGIFAGMIGCSLEIDV
jgi:hypothetical protein